VALAVVAIHVLVFVLSPQFHFKPYRLEAEMPIVVQDVPNIEIPAPPKEVSPPPIEYKPTDDLNADDIDPIRTSFDDIGDMPLPPRLAPGPKTPFVPFDKAPVPLHLFTPVYPKLAREAGIEGKVHVKVVIDTQGRVVETVVVKSDVTPAMTRAAVEAAKSCRFKPAMQRNVPVKVTVVIPFEFRLSK
jgi:protein TonB